MKKALYKNDMSALAKDIDRLLHPTILRYNNEHKAYGESSGHLYPIFPELYRRYENTARFVLLTRKPVDFVRSALARGFFNPDHPFPLEHAIPPKNTEMGRRWKEATPLEKCAWYWAMVNGFVYRFFISLPATIYKIVPIESLSIDVIEELYDFLDLKDFNEVKSDIYKLLLVRHNASPGQGEKNTVNPYSRNVFLGQINTWSHEQVDELNMHVLPVQEAIYGSKLLVSKNINDLTILR